MLTRDAAFYGPDSIALGSSETPWAEYARGFTRGEVPAGPGDVFEVCVPLVRRAGLPDGVPARPGGRRRAFARRKAPYLLHGPVARVNGSLTPAVG